jgi:multidrug efflux pump subunit AcrA (membrane-fusion protein)
MRRHLVRVALAVAVSGLASGCAADGAPESPAGGDVAAADPRPVGALRLTGTVEAVRTRAVTAPRLQGASLTMIITYLVPAGTRVAAGDLLVAFDPQEQERLAFDARAELVDLEGQIAKKQADQAAADAKDQTELVAARNDVSRAKLAIQTNELIAPVEAEKNTLALQQAEAKLAQLEKTYALKREAAAADLQILEIRRERSARALVFAERNAELMELRAPFAGLVVIKTTFRGSSGLEPFLEGDQVRYGQPIVDIVDTDAMQVRLQVNQADAGLVRAGQSAVVRLDGFPELAFEGRVESVTPLLTPSARAADVRSLSAVVSIDGSHEQLLPDLTASVEILADDAADEVAVAASAATAGGSR